MAGGGGNTTSTVTQSNLPAYAKPYYTNLMDRAGAESQTPYQTYNAPRLTGMSDPTNVGLNMASGYANSSLGAGDTALDFSTAAGIGGLNAQGYAGANFNNSYNGPQQGNYQAGSFGTDAVGWSGGTPFTGVDRVSAGEFDQSALDKYSSPFMQAVVDKAKQDALLNYQEEAAMRGANAATTGAFGGSRAAVQEQMARNNLQSNLTDITTQGAQKAFENAQSQFERDRAASMAAQQANQGAGLTMSQANQRAALEAQQLGEQSRQYGYGATEDAYSKAAQLGLTAQQGTEQSRQFGSELGLRGLDLANQSANQLMKSQEGLDQMMLNRIKSQLGIGSTVEGYAQQQLDQSYNDFVNQRDAERQNLQFLSSILQGVPISANQDITTTQGTNPLAGMLGSATGLQALMGLGQQ